MRYALLAAAVTLTACLTGPAQEPTRVEQGTVTVPEPLPGPGTRPYRLLMGRTTVSGRLHPELIQLIVRRGYERFRLCLDAGFARNSKLAGRIEVHFVIGRDGLVSHAQSLRAPEFPDPQVAQCVVEAFRGLVFPEPDWGTVTVHYPMLVEPKPVPGLSPASQ
jgi:hypothetical protein